VAKTKRTVKVEFSKEIQSRMLGHLLTKKGWVSDAQLKKALNEQGKRKRKGKTILLGRLLLEMGMVSDFELAEILRLQSELNRQREQCAMAQLSIAELCIKAKDYKTAIQECKKLLKVYGDCRQPASRAQKLIGDCYQHLGQHTNARKAYENTIDDYHVD